MNQLDCQFCLIHNMKIERSQTGRAYLVPWAFFSSCSTWKIWAYFPLKQAWSPVMHIGWLATDTCLARKVKMKNVIWFTSFQLFGLGSCNKWCLVCKRAGVQNFWKVTQCKTSCAILIFFLCPSSSSELREMLADGFCPYGTPILPVWSAWNLARNIHSFSSQPHGNWHHNSMWHVFAD
jgi:hypothetical protein